MDTKKDGLEKEFPFNYVHVRFGVGVGTFYKSLNKLLSVSSN